MADQDTYRVELELTASNKVSSAANDAVRDLGRIDNAMEELERENARMQRTMQQMGGMIQGAFAGLSLQAVRGFAEDMYDVGTQTRIAATTFEQLSGGADIAASTLERLRATTGNIVSDYELMSGASRLLSMGLASNAQEVETLTNLAVRLGGAMGQDAATAINEFSLMLANQSVERLDAFSINSGIVRQRIDELLASGEALNRSDAFTMAVMEQGAQSLARLGDAAFAAETPMARLQTRIENVKAELSEGFAVGVDTLLALAEGVSVRTQSDQEIRDAIVRSGIELTAWQQGQMWQSGVTLSDPRQILDTAQTQQLRLFMDNERISREIYEAQGRITDEIQRQNELIAQQRTQQQQMRGVALETYDSYMFLFEGYNGFINSINQGRRGAIDGTWLFSPEEAQRAQEIADAAAVMESQIAPLVELELFPPSWTQAAADLTQRTRELAEQAQEGADAYERMTLAIGFRESGGGMFGEIGDQVLAALQDSEMEDADRQALQDAIDLASGRVTEASLTMRDEVIPMLVDILNTYGSDALIGAMGGVEGAIRDANLRGLTPEQLAGTLPMATGFTRFGGGGGQQLVVNPGDGVWGLARRYGMSEAEVMRILGISDRNEIFQPGTYGGGGGGAVVPLSAFDNPAGMWGMGFGGVLTDAQDVSTALDEWQTPLDAAYGKVVDVQGVLQDINATVYKADIELAVKDPANILGILTGTAQLPPGISATTTIRAAVRDSGGRVPGQDGRVRPER